MEHIDKVIGTFEKTEEMAASEKEIVMPEKVSRAVVARLPRYHRYLRTLIEEGHLRTSSSELARMMNITASQIRQDLNCFGGFGQQGYGYTVKYLYSKIGELLGVEEDYRIIIIGAGNLGRALAGTHMFERRGMTRVAMFDKDPNMVGHSIYGLPVLHIDELETFCLQNRVDFAIMTTPREVTQDIAMRLAGLRIKGILNFANVDLRVPYKDMVVENVHLSDPLMKFCFDLKNNEKNRKNKSK
jgi:redox-sensing transcriptional repressor